jgi:hypothetical protein
VRKKQEDTHPFGPAERERHFEAGYYICPVTQAEVPLESEVPRAWLDWPVNVVCKECGRIHLLGYEDVHQVSPVFGYE